MTEIVTDSSDVLGYVITYNITKKVISGNLPSRNDIEYVKTDDGKYVSGFNIKFSKSNLDECLQEARVIADKIACLISLQVREDIKVNFSGYGGIPKQGKTARVSKSFTFRWNVQGKEPVLNLRDEDLSRVLKADEPQHQYLQLFSNAISHFKNGSVVESLKELFAIIEYDTTFPNYDRYYGLRQIFSHTPRVYKKNEPYQKSTIDKFTENFGLEDFDYLKFEPQNNLIIVDINSKKTHERLKQIVSEFIDELKGYLSRKFGFME